MHLSVIIPAYNEEKNLTNTIKEVAEFLNSKDYEWEIIVVNDGSTDKTANIAENLSYKYPEIRLINNDVNKGKGAVVRQGLMNAEGEYRLFMDADNATTIHHVDKIWPLFERGFDIVIGSRNAKDVAGAKQEIKQALWKRILGISGNKIIQFLTVRGIWDTQCGFKAFTREAAKKIIPKASIDRWALDVEFLVIARKMNLKIGIIPVVWKNAGYSRVGIKGYFSFLKEVLKIKWNLIRGRYN